jgi:SHS2 domain-containing protein
MPYRYLPEIAIADIAFEATGGSLEELFTVSGEALMNVMVDDLSTIEPKEEMSITLTHREIDLLLFDFLEEFIFLKDARQLLLRVRTISISKEGEAYTLFATLYGEKLDPERHPLRADVKAVTLHRFTVKETEQGWRATVVLDI